MALEDLTRYQYGALSARLLQTKEGSAFIGGALEQLAYDLNIEKSALGFIRGSMASENGLKIAAGEYAEIYENAEGELKISELYNFYKKDIDKYLKGEEKEIISKKYASDNTNVGDIKKKIAKIKHNLKSPDEKERKDAEKEIKEYQDIIVLLHVIQDEQYKNLLPKAIERTNKRLLEGLAKA